MSDSESSDNNSSDSNEGPTHFKALPCPDEAVELASKMKTLGNNEFLRIPTPPLPTTDNSPAFALPWNSECNNSEEINILLLGESGVGKSTFINSFANYMKHENFEAVQQNNLRVLIPARFHIFDKNFEKHLIEIGANDNNEHLADGEAATQDVQTYVFYVTIEHVSYKIRLIDTPGMGDPRGIDQDNKNCDYVLNYLGRLEKVHAICLLLKPTNTRLDVFLNYCITQILSRLEKSATDNICFLFTNTRGQNYTPGDTYTSLELLVKKIKDTNNVFLPLSKNNVFCFDNEAFRFLAATKQNVEFQEGILEANIESWRYSYKEVYRVLSYIVNLKPHDPKKTIGINHARKMVLQLAQPLAEIVQLIGDNIYELDQHTNQLLIENQSLEELKQKLHMPVIDIKVKELPQPVTVCTSPKCSAIYKVGDKNKYHYKQRCHNPCYLNNVPAEIVGDPAILSCWAMTKSTQTCHQCQCRFNTHMHVYYETETFKNNIVDTNVLRNINTKEDAANEKQRLINNILDHKKELELEHTYIIKCTAAFAHFLQQNAITPINDSLKEYIKYLITREENLGPNLNRSTLDYLRRLLAQYEQEKHVLEEALKYDTASNRALDNSPKAIEQKIRELFTLQHFGKKIKQLYDLHQLGGIAEHKQSEFVVKEHYNLSVVGKVKGFVKNVFGFGNADKKKQNEIARLNMEMQRYYNTMTRLYSNKRENLEHDSEFLFDPRFYWSIPQQNSQYSLSNRSNYGQNASFQEEQIEFTKRQNNFKGKNGNDEKVKEKSSRKKGQKAIQPSNEEHDSDSAENSGNPLKKENMKSKKNKRRNKKK